MDLKAFELRHLFDDNNKVCIEPLADANGLATVNQEVNAPTIR